MERSASSPPSHPERHESSPEETCVSIRVRDEVEDVLELRAGGNYASREDMRSEKLPKMREKGWRKVSSSSSSS